MKQRDAAISARGEGANGPHNKGGAAEIGASLNGAANSSAAAAVAASAQQQRFRGLEEKVADLEAKLEHALAEKERSELQLQITVSLLMLFKVRARRNHVRGTCAGGCSQCRANGCHCQGMFVKNINSRWLSLM
jgi:hypothetical protein